MYETYYRYKTDPDHSSQTMGQFFGTQKRDENTYREQLEAAAKQGPAGLQQIGPELFSYVCDINMLRFAWNQLAEVGGQAPGPNGRSYRDYSNQEVWELLRVLSSLLTANAFCPGPGRKIEIQKDPQDPSRGTRTLTLPDIEVRVVQRAVLNLLNPLLDALFGETIIGFRPGYDLSKGIAGAEHVGTGALQRQRVGYRIVGAPFQQSLDHGRIVKHLKHHFSNSC